MKIKIVISIVAGVAGFLILSTLVWIYLSVNTLKSGGNQPDLEMDRVAGILLPLAIGCAVASAGWLFFRMRQIEKRPLKTYYNFVLVLLLPFIVSFSLLIIAYYSLPTMQITNSGEPVSQWGYLLISGLPVVVGLFIGMFLESLFFPEKNDSDKEI